MWKVALWEEVLEINGIEAHYTYQVYNKSIVIPETINAICITAEALGIWQDFLIE
jgi:glyceraldehyde-3-phosphate dehydrogenase (NAD(P))